MVSLSPFGPADFPDLLAWISTPELLVQWAGPTFRWPLNEAQLAGHLSLTEGPEPSLLAYTALEAASGRAIGHVELSNLERANGTASLSKVLVGPEDLRGRGWGRAIVRAALRVAFDDLRLHRVELRVFSHNEAAIACYERVGFRREGLLRDTRRVGDRYWSSVVMGMLEAEWRALEAAERGVAAPPVSDRRRPSAPAAGPPRKEVIR